MQCQLTHVLENLWLKNLSYSTCHLHLIYFFILMCQQQETICIFLTSPTESIIAVLSCDGEHSGRFESLNLHLNSLCFHPLKWLKIKGSKRMVLCGAAAYQTCTAQRNVGSRFIFTVCGVRHKPRQITTDCYTPVKEPPEIKGFDAGSTPHPTCSSHPSAKIQRQPQAQKSSSYYHKALALLNILIICQMWQVVALIPKQNNDIVSNGL